MTMGFCGPRRELVLHVGDLAPQLVVDAGKILGPVLVLELDQDVRHPGAGDGHLDVLDLLHALDRVLDVVGHLVLDLLGGGAGIEGDDLGLLDGERRVFQLAHALEAERPPPTMMMTISQEMTLLRTEYSPIFIYA